MAKTTGTRPKRIRCAVYTRKSSDEGLEQEFNSLHAQREACEAYIASQRHEGWHGLSAHYDDGGYSGEPWSALPCSAFSATSVPARSTSWWSIKSIV